MAARAFFSVLIVLLLYRYRKYASTNYFLDLVYLSFLLQCHSRLHVVTGLARSDFVPPHSHVHLQNGRQHKMASVGCSPLSEIDGDAANGTTFLRSASSSSSNATSNASQEFQQEKRCAACWLPLVQGVLPMVSENTPVRYVSNDELARRAARCMPGGDMYEP